MSGGSGGANAGSATHQMQSNQQATGTIQRPAHAKEYHFLDIELKYGILQVSFRPRRSLNGISITFHSFPCRRQEVPYRAPYGAFCLFVCLHRYTFRTRSCTYPLTGEWTRTECESHRDNKVATTTRCQAFWLHNWLFQMSCVCVGMLTVFWLDCAVAPHFMAELRECFPPFVKCARTKNHENNFPVESFSSPTMAHNSRWITTARSR